MSVKPLLSEKTRTCNAVLRVLEEAEIDMVFGIAGGDAGRLMTALAQHQNTIRTLMVREESLAAVMAEVYGRLTGKPGVVIGQGPWVLGNGMIGIVEARMSSTPMLLLTDFSNTPGFALHAPYQAATGDYGAWNARQAYGGVAKTVYEASDPVAAVQATQFAIKAALSGQRGPVAVLYSQESLVRSIEPVSRPQLYSTGPYIPTKPAADPARVARAAEAIAAAKKLIIIAGNGVRIADAYDALARLAEQAGIPVVSTATGKGVFPETHDLALGVFGPYGLAAANAAVGEADVVIAVATKLGATDTIKANTSVLDPVRQTFVQIEIEPRNASWTFPSEHTLVADARLALEQLCEALGSDAGRRERAAARVAALRETHGYFDTPTYESDAVPILPQRVIGELRRNLPDDAIVTCDAGENRILMTHFYQTRKPTAFLQAGGSGPMGYAIPAAMGAKLVHPDRTVVAVCGDGGFAMTMNGLMSAVEHKIPIVVVVFNNHALGWVLHLAGPFQAEFNDFDHAAIARAMGCRGVRVTDPADLAGALREAIGSSTPTVIDVITSLDVSWRDVTSPLVE